MIEFNIKSLFLLVISIFLSSTSIFAQQNQPLLQITSPADGTIVTSGETITVTVSVNAGTHFSRGIGIIAQSPIQANNIAVSAPYQIPVTIPNDIQPGQYSLTAVGLHPSTQGNAISQPIFIDVESPGTPKVLQLCFLNTPVKNFTIDIVGKQLPLQIQGILSNGNLVPLTDSSYVTFSSSNSSVMAVTSDGVVTAISPGIANVTATYNHTNPFLQVTIPVTVSPQTITLSPWSLSFAPQLVGLASGPQTVTLTSAKPLNSIQVTTTGDFSETDNCSVATPTTSCVINVKFIPTIPGNTTGNLNVATKLTSTSTSIGLSGTGTVVPFAAFNPRLNIYDKNPYGFHLRGTFKLDNGSGSIDPASQAVTLTIDAFSITIPAGSFKKDLSFHSQQQTGFISSQHGKFYYDGQINGVDLEIKIEPDQNSQSQYKFEFKGIDVNLSSMINSPVVSLLIGDNMGTVTLSTCSHSDSDKDERD